LKEHIMNNNEEKPMINSSVHREPADCLAKAADRLLAGLDDGTVDPAAVALADALDGYVTELSDPISLPVPSIRRFEAVLDLIGRISLPPATLAWLIADACDCVAIERGNPKSDPALQVMVQHLVWALGMPRDEEHYAIALQSCLDRCCHQ
jgi:hypothetical protein